MWHDFFSAKADTSTERGRTKARYQRAVWGMAGNLAARAAGMLTMVLAVYWSAPVLGSERFGVWSLFASLVAALSFLDFGIGNALINKVAHAEASHDNSLLRQVIVAGLGWLLIAALASSAVLMLLSLSIPWERLLRLSSAAIAAEAQASALTFSMIFGVHTFASGALKVLLGLQRSHEAHAATTLSALAAAVAISVAVGPDVTIPALLAATFGVQSLGGIVALALLQRRRLIAFESVAASMRLHSSAMLSTGSLFLVLQIGTMVGWGLDSFLLGATSGAAAVAAFAVTQRLFQFASQPVAVLNAPLWPAYADAHARGDRAFVRSTFRRSMLLSLGVGALLAVVLTTAGPWITHHWTQGSIDVSLALLAAAGTWVLLEVWGIAFGTYLNGVGIVREQVVVVVVFCVVALPAKYFASSYLGATGLVVASALSYLATIVLLYATVFRRRVCKPLQRMPL